MLEGGGLAAETTSHARPRNVIVESSKGASDIVYLEAAMRIDPAVRDDTQGPIVRR